MFSVNMRRSNLWEITKRKTVLNVSFEIVSEFNCKTKINYGLIKEKNSPINLWKNGQEIMI